MPSIKTFFQQESLMDQLSGRRKAFVDEIDKLSQQQFDATPDDQIVAHFVARGSLDPIVLHEDRAFLEVEPTQVDISRDPYRQFFERPKGALYRPGRRMIISIPFDGEEWLFDYKTNPFMPHMKIQGDIKSAMFDGEETAVRLHILAANDVPEDTLVRQIDEAREGLRRFVQASFAQVRGFNTYFQGEVTSAVAARRSRSVQHVAIATKLNIPMKRKPEAPPLEPVAVSPRFIPPLNSSRSGEYGITEEDHKLILHFIRHQGRTYETTPDTYAMHDEEGLRDIVLGQLNGHFKGSATGETFRCKGKTDIRIEAGDRSAFVAECKLWKGSIALQKALTQLLGYVMWRDSKAALIVFNKSNTSMGTVVSSIPKALETTGLVVGSIVETSTGEWSLTMRNSADPHHTIALQIFAFDIRRRKYTST